MNTNKQNLTPLSDEQPAGTTGGVMMSANPMDWHVNGYTGMAMAIAAASNVNE